MGGSAGKSRSRSGNQASSSQDVWGPQGDALSGLYDQIGSTMGGLLGTGGKGSGAGGKGSSGGQGMLGQIAGASQGMQDITDTARPAWEQQLGGGAYQGMDLQRNYQTALQGGGNEQFMNQQIMGGQGNDYVDAMRGQMQRESGDALGRNLASNDLRAANAGMGGSSRHGITESGIRDASSRNLSDAQTRLGYDTFAQNQDRQMGIAQRADQFDMGRLQNASGMLGAQNQAMQGGLKGTSGMQNANMGQFAPYSAPGDMMSGFANMIGRPTVLSQGQGGGNSSSKGMGFGGGKKG